MGIYPSTDETCFHILKQNFSHHCVNISVDESIKASYFVLLMGMLIKYLFQQIAFGILINTAAV